MDESTFENDMEPDSVEVDGFGDIIVEDFQRRKFYNAFVLRTAALLITRGDCVRINLEVPDDVGDMFAIGIVNAIFEIDNRMMVEIRWLYKAQEIPEIRRKT